MSHTSKLYHSAHKHKAKRIKVSVLNVWPQQTATPFHGTAQRLHTVTLYCTTSGHMTRG